MNPIIHLDMNSYFASVEQQANPFLRNKVLGVCAYLGENGCIIAPSIEAKAVGIKTGMRVKDARKIYKNIFLVENDPNKYRTTTKHIFSILADYTDKVEPYSIDEAFMDLSGFVTTYEAAEILVREIKDRIRNEVGEWLRCSVGISYTRFLAKLASKYKKPDGLTVLKPNQLDDFYAKITLLDIWGINYRIERRLNQLGIKTPMELKNYPVTNIMQALGKYGYYLWGNLNGQEISGVSRRVDIQPKSIGHSYCLPKKTSDTTYLNGMLMKLCERTARRMRAKKLEATKVSFYFRYQNGGGFHKQTKQPEPLFSSQCIFHAIQRIFASIVLQDNVTMLSVAVSDLIPRRKQSSLFSDNKEKQRALHESLDLINDKFGEFTVILGNMVGTENYAKDRIGYRKSVDVDEIERHALRYEQEL